MNIVSCSKIDISTISPSSQCNVYVLYVQVTDIPERANEMIQTISETSWIDRLSPIDSLSFSARAQRTIEKLVTELFAKTLTSDVTADFGEYLVSMTAQDSLASELKHTPLPLAELFKEKLSGNPGFDFHTVSADNLLTFGEAKYSGTENPYTRALSQIKRFIKEKKDIMEFTDLSKLASEDALKNAFEGRKAYAAAFSLNEQDTALVFKKALATKDFATLLSCAELYLIGVEIVD